MMNQPRVPIPIAPDYRHDSKKFRYSFMLVFGVILPALAISIEHWSHICAQSLLDPLPTKWHVLFASLVPVSNFFTWLAIRVNLEPFFVPLALLNGIAVGTALFYTILFLPALPIAIPLLIVLGAGLLPMSPLLALISSMKAGKILELLKPAGMWSEVKAIKHVGHVIAIGLLLGIELPSATTRIAMEMASHQKTAPQALAFLRTFGDKEVMLRMCYERSKESADIIGGLAELVHPVPPEQARNLFYRVTGKPFNSLAVASSARATIRHSLLRMMDEAEAQGLENSERLSSGDDFDFDPDVAGEVVGGVARGVDLASSNFSVSVDSKAAVAHMDWQMRLANSSDLQREARAQILLPPGAVLNEAILRVHGVDRPAVFGKKSSVRAAYQAVVRQKKDPLLVTTCGPNRLLVQCFPVQPHDEMQLRLGLAVPLKLTSSSDGDLVLPAFIERNFQTPAAHTVHLTSTSPISQNSFLKVSSPTNGSYTANGHVTQEMLGSFETAIRCSRDEQCKTVVCTAVSHAPDLYQELQAVREGPPAELIAVIDGSVEMQAYLNEIAEALSRLPSNVSINIVTDGSNDLAPFASSGTDSFSRAVQSLKSFHCVGGQDDSPVLLAAARQIAGNNHAAILWIHSAQPVLLNETKSYRKQLQEGLKDTQLFDVQIHAGPNRVVETLDRAANYHLVCRMGTVRGDLDRLIGEWKGTLPVYSLLRQVNFEHTPASLDVAQSRDVASLWVADEVRRAVLNNLPGELSEAEVLAAKCRVVTPLTGAVVLETDEDYRRNKLSPPPPPTEKPKVFQSFASKPLKDAFGSVTSQLNALQGGGMDAASLAPEAKMEAFAASEATGKYPGSAPALSGSTNGTIGPQSGSADVAPGFEDADAVPTVPESDTYLLMAAIALLFGICFAQMKKNRKAAQEA